MTSANVIEYRIFNKQGNVVGYHRENIMCQTHWDKLLQFHPLEDHTIQAFGYDEDEEYWEDKVDEISSLRDFLIRVGEIQLK